MQSTAAMQAGLVVDLTAQLTRQASKLTLAHELPMADGIILATAQAFKATIWTQDADFEKIPGVRFYPKE
jgi:toxin FitB